MEEGGERVYACGESRQCLLTAGLLRTGREQMESVLYMKMEQHESVKRLLLDTGHAQLVFGDHTDSWWGDGDDGNGSNEMGKALMRVRDGLRERGHV